MERQEKFYGLKVFITPDTPKMKLAPGDYVTPAFREEMDQWLREFFGTTNLIADGSCLMSEAMGTVHMNHRTFVKFKSAVWDRGIT